MRLSKKRVFALLSFQNKEVQSKFIDFGKKLSAKDEVGCCDDLCGCKATISIVVYVYEILKLFICCF